MERLLAKYEEILRLRSEGARDAAAARPALRALAAEFPGALRELDSLPMEEIEARLAALRVVRAGAPGALWMRVLESYHRNFRAALAVKAALAAGALDTTEVDGAWWDRRGAVHRPPGGRLTPLVVACVAEELSLPIATVTAALQTRLR